MVRLSQNGWPRADTLPPTPTRRMTEMMPSWCSPASCVPDCVYSLPDGVLAVTPSIVHGPFSSPSSFVPWSDCVNMGNSTAGLDHVRPSGDVA